MNDPTPPVARPAQAASGSSRLTVSVVIPAYNAARFVRDAVGSILAQSSPTLEVIVVDDGSADDTADIVRSDFPTVRLLNQAHRGVSAARNRGWRAARGEVIGFLDADDRYLPDKLRVQLAVLETHPRLGLVHSGWRLTDAAGKPTSDSTPWCQAQRLDIEGWLLWKPVFLGGMLMRRSWLEAVGGFSEDLHQAEDVDLVLRMALAGCRAGWCKRVTTIKRQHGQSLTRNGAQQVRSLAEVLDRFFAHPRLPRRIRRLEPKVRYYSFVWSAWHTYQLGELEESRRCLAASLPWSRRPAELTVVEWQSQFARRLSPGSQTSALRALRPVFQKAAGIALPQWRDTEGLLNWTLEVWHPLLSGDLAASVDGLRTAGGTTGRELAKRAQSAMLGVNSPPEAAAVCAWWNAAVREGLFPRAQRHEVTTLHLTLFSQAVFRRQWAAAAGALGYAVRSGWRPAAAPAWGRFVSAAARHARHLLCKSSDRSAARPGAGLGAHPD